MNSVTTDKPLIADILSVGSPAALRALGSFAALKQALRDALGLGIKTHSWANLYTIISAFQIAATSDSTPPARDAAQQRLSDALRASFAGKLEAGAGAHDADRDVSRAMTQLLLIARDPSVQYRLTRSENFIESSRLEGIDLRTTIVAALAH